jgi:hypothetical protein
MSFRRTLSVNGRRRIPGGCMDFIEKIFGLAPDAGSGSLEAALFVAAMVGLALVVKARKRAKAARPIT